MKFNSKNPVAPHHLGALLENVFTGNFPMYFDDHHQNNLSRPAVNIKESESAYILELLAPGIAKDEIKIDVEGKKLVVSYQKEETTNETTENYIRSEFKFDSFKRSFTLNDKTDLSSITATYENGILAINIPKKEEAIS